MAVFVITGPPCAGKSTLAWRLARPDDVVLDFDDICGQLDGRPNCHDHSPSVKGRAGVLMGRRMRQLPLINGDGYLIRWAPQPEVRTYLATLLNATVWMINPGQEECVRRAEADQRPPHTLRSIMQWYSIYRPADVDTECPHLA